MPGARQPHDQTPRREAARRALPVRPAVGHCPAGRTRRFPRADSPAKMERMDVDHSGRQSERRAGRHVACRGSGPRRAGWLLALLALVASACGFNDTLRGYGRSAAKGFAEGIPEMKEPSKKLLRDALLEGD